MLKHYVEFVYPGIMVSETSEKEIKSRDQKIVLPKGAFGYHFFDREEVTKDGEVLVGKDKNHSGFFYEGRKMSLADVEREEPDQRILISNMRNNNIPFVCRTEYGQAIPMKDGDQIIGKEAACGSR